MTHWQVEHHVRDDAPSLFVPGGDLPDAEVGDTVTVMDPDHGAPREGHVTAVATDATRGLFVTVEFALP